MERPRLSDPAPEGDHGFCLPDTFPMMFQVSDMAGTIQRVSDAWLDAMGYRRAEVIGRRTLDFFSPESAKAADHLQDDLTKDGHIRDAQYALCSKNGDIMWFVLSGALLAACDGVPVGSVLMMNSLAKNEKTIDGLRRKSFRLQSCLEGTNAGTWEWNVQTGETFFNERWAEIVGYSLEELEPISIDTWLSLAHPEDLQASGAALQAHWQGKSDFYDFEARMRHKDGHWVWVHDRGRVFTRTGDGQPEWMFGTHFSLENLRRQAAESEAMKRLLDRTGKVAGVGGWEVDLETDEITWTAETRRIHGVDDDYTPSFEKVLEFYAPEARDAVRQAVETALTDGSPWDLELPFTKATGEMIWVRAVGEVVFQNSAPSRIFGAFQDITSRVKQTEVLRAAIAALEQSNTELDQFAYVASHDLKAPLRVIANATHWIEEDLEGQVSDTVRKSMDLVHSRIRRMDRLLTDLLEHARIGRTAQDTKLVTCAEILAEVSGLIDLPAGFRILSGSGLEEVMIPRMPATKILLNLIGNAVKHHDKEDGFVRLDAVQTEDRVTLSVQDDGAGIPVELHDRAFELFQTLRPRDQVEGSGMGLAIVQKAVKIAGGNVHLASDGRGCAFTVDLPRQPDVPIAQRLSA